MKILVKSIMTENVTVANFQHKFSQVMEFFEKFNIRHLPVTDGNKVIGIISIRDVLKDLYTKLSGGEPVSLAQMNESFSIRDLMTATPVTIGPEAEVEEAMQIMKNGGFHALPVAESGELQGIITDYDLMKAYYKETHPPVHYSSGAPGFGV